MAYSLNTLDSDGSERFSLRRSVGRLIQETGLVLGLALIVPLLVEGEKAVRRRRLAKAGGR